MDSASLGVRQVLDVICLHATATGSKTDEDKVAALADVSCWTSVLCATIARLVRFLSSLMDSLPRHNDGMSSRLVGTANVCLFCQIEHQNVLVPDRATYWDGEHAGRHEADGIEQEALCFL